MPAIIINDVLVDLPLECVVKETDLPKRPLELFIEVFVDYGYGDPFSLWKGVKTRKEFSEMKVRQYKRIHLEG